MAYFDHADLPAWTLDHPYRDPLEAVTLVLPDPSGAHYEDPRPWSADGDTRLDLPWVPLGESLQWAAFKRMVRELRSRRNRVSVLVGPLNEHMLTESDAEAYRRSLTEALAWLEGEGIPFLAPGPLPSDGYADLSHPLDAEGYAFLARELWAAMRVWR
jgi:hypothetical protein